MGKWRTPIIVCCILLVLAGMIRIYYRVTDDFRISNITYKLPFEAPWKTVPLTADENAQLDLILNQKFSYLDKGSQSYAFESADGLYVLKFFKFKHLKPNMLVEWLPNSSYKEDYIQKKQLKLKNVFDAYDLASREDKENVEIVYLHLIPAENFNKQVTVLDKLGFKRSIDLNATSFMIQRKGETLRSRLSRLLKQNDLAGAKDSIHRLLMMYVAEYQKGIYDRDHGVMINAGFVGDHPFHLDAGKFTKIERMKEKEVYTEDLELVIWKIEEWIKNTYPQNQEELFTYMEEIFHQMTGQDYDRSKINLELFKTRRHSALLNP